MCKIYKLFNFETFNFKQLEIHNSEMTPPRSLHAVEIQNKSWKLINLHTKPTSRRKENKIKTLFCLWNLADVRCDTNKKKKKQNFNIWIWTFNGHLLQKFRLFFVIAPNFISKICTRICKRIGVLPVILWLFSLNPFLSNLIIHGYCSTNQKQVQLS